MSTESVQWWGCFNYGNRLLLIGRTRRDVRNLLFRESFDCRQDEFDANIKHYQFRRVTVTFEDAP
jgi:hypothetical protein